MKKISLILLFSITLGSCASLGKEIFITPVPESQSEAGKFYTKRCSGCHSLPHPGRHTFKQWKHMLGVMKLRMEERGVPSLSEEESEEILGYLNRHARGNKE